VRVHELARELGVSTKDALAALDQMGLQGLIALSSVPEQAVRRLRAPSAGPTPGALSHPTVAEPPSRSPAPAPKPAEARPTPRPPFGTRQVATVAKGASGGRPGGNGDVGASGRSSIRAPSGASRPAVAARPVRTSAEAVRVPGMPSHQGPLVAPKPPSPGPVARWRARRAVREEARVATGSALPAGPSVFGRWRARRRVKLEAGRGRPPQPSLLARARARWSSAVVPKPPRPGLGTRLSRRATTAPPASGPGRPLLRTRQDRVLAVAAVLLIAGAFSTFAVLRSEPVQPVSRVLSPGASPSLRLEPSPTGGDLAIPGALPAPEPSPSPSPRLGLARGVGVSAVSPTPFTPPAPSSAAAAPPTQAQAPPPTVEPNPPAPTTKPPQPPPTTKPPSPTPTEPSPTPTEPSPSPTESDNDDD
jgi:hypothetical protein